MSAAQSIPTSLLRDGTPPRPPGLTLAERDRRWARARVLMREHHVDGLLLAGFRAREMYESYLSDDYCEGCTIFPADGDPVVLSWSNLRVMRARWSAERGDPLWIDDYRVAASGTACAEVLREKGLTGRLGIVGLRSQAPTEVYGAIPANFWHQILAAIPGIKVEELSEAFSFMMLTKSDEELAQVRYAAACAEAACRVVVDVASEGVDEAAIMAAATGEMLRHGVGLRYPMVVMNSGPHTLSWGPARWTTRGEAPRVLQRGDMLQAELMPMCGNQEVQVQLSIALDPVDDINRECERIARASYDAGLVALRPGLKFSELLAAMEVPLREGGAWGYTPLVHSVGPHFLTGRATVNLPDLGIRVHGRPPAPTRDPVLDAGMVFSFEPNACIGHHRVNIGGTVIVTDDGCEELNFIATRVVHK